jgi:hypothetical protein
MKSSFVAGIFSVLALPLWGAAPTYIINSPINAPPDPFPQIDATVFINRSAFTIFNDSSGFAPLPFETQSTRVFTNEFGATMVGTPGFRFLRNQGQKRSSMDTWVNEGSITASQSGLFAFGLPTVIVGLGASPSLIHVQANNIISPGPLNAGSDGLIRLEGKSIDLTRSGLRTGDDPFGTAFFGSSVGASNYVNDPGVSDLYWGVGVNNRLDNMGQPMGLGANRTANDPFFELPCPQSPTHQVIEAQFGFLFTNLVFLPTLAPCSFFGSSNYTAVAYTNVVSPTSAVIQVVFYPTNNLDTNISTTVEFIPDGDDGRQVVVAINSADYDIVTQTVVNNSVFVIDDLAFATNAILARNLNLPTFRPSTYAITRGTPFLGFGFPPNAPYDPTLLYNPSYQSNAVAVNYTAYAADVSSIPLPPPALLGTVDSTNYPGRVDLSANQLNLDSARIRANSSFNLKAGNLGSNRLAQVDAPFINFSGNSTLPELVISNLAPATVRRLSGRVQCWSGIWNNLETNAVATNFLRFHVLFVDHNLRAIQPVVVERFSSKAPSLVLRDFLRISKAFSVNTTNLTFPASGGLSLPRGMNLARTNLLNVLSVTNDGVVSVAQEAHWGDDRRNASGKPIRYRNFVNRGTNTAAAQFVRTSNFDNSGSFEAVAGTLSVDALTAKTLGGQTIFFTNVTTNVFLISFPPPVFFTNISTNILTNTFAARLSGNSLVQIRARDWAVSNSLIQAGTLSIAVTNNLLATNLDARSTWITINGFSMLRRPKFTNSLMGVDLVSLAPNVFQLVRHTWAADNRGASPAGYSNNLAVGRLILDGASNAVFRFSGTTANRALYVDHLELRNFATNYNGSSGSLRIDSSITIYIASANIPPEKLTNAYPNRLQWVSSFTGPFSSTNIVAVRTNEMGDVFTNTYLMNLALATSRDIDSDGDGCVNWLDPDPLNCGPEPCACASASSLFMSAATLSKGRSPAVAVVPARPTALAPVLSIRPTLFSLTHSPADPLIPSPVGGSVGEPVSGRLRQIVLSWTAPAGATTELEFTDSLTLTKWQVLTNFVTGSTSRTVTVTDDVSAQGQRYYRVRILPAAP